jgi:hypothetical protein
MPGAGRRIPVALNRQSGVNLGAPIGRRELRAMTVAGR